MKNIQVIILLAILALASCSGNDELNKNSTISTDSIIDSDVLIAESNYDGFQLMQSSCFSCHNPNPMVEDAIAPTLAEIKKNYLASFEDQSDFESAFISFLENPNEERAIMKDAIDEFGSMPQMSLGSVKAKAIASYMFNENVEADDWYSKYFQSEQRRVKLLENDLSDIDRGFEYAMATKSVLGKNLKGKLKSDGPLGALNFCNLNAYAFTDSMSQVYDATIRRVSDKPRNLDNTASALELEIIESFKKQLAAGDEIQPETRAFLEGYIHGFYPIVTNEMCMKCHGDVSQMEAGLFENILALYPEDQATGYSPNQLRGIWVVKMKKNH